MMDTCKKVYPPTKREYKTLDMANTYVRLLWNGKQNSHLYKGGSLWDRDALPNPQRFIICVI